MCPHVLRPTGFNTKIVIQYGISSQQTITFEYLSPGKTFCSKVFRPHLHDRGAPRFYDPHDVPQRLRLDMRIVITEKASACACYPYLCGICCRDVFTDVDVHRLQRAAFVRPKEDRIGTKLKNLRHRIHLPVQIQGSGALFHVSA